MSNQQQALTTFTDINHALFSTYKNYVYNIDFNQGTLYIGNDLSQLCHEKP